jgi:curli biogenesis system outer membrane secretion channel CsgG
LDEAAFTSPGKAGLGDRTSFQHEERFMQRYGLVRRWTGLAAMAAMVALAGCASVGESGQRDQVTANVGNYSPAPSGIDKPRVGVPPFSVKDQSQSVAVGKRELQSMAADQMTTLMFQTARFDVIERAQLEQMLREQDLEGIVRPGELAGRGKVRGVDYLLIGKITAFRIKVDRTSQEAGVQSGYISNELLDGITGGFSQNEKNITTELGVDIRLVDPETGQVYAANFTDYKRTDTAKSMGLDIAGVGASGDSDIRINRDDAGKVLRLAFDDALKKGMSQIDSMLRSRHAGGTRTAGGSSGATAQPAANVNDGSGGQAAGPKFCPNCGEELANRNASFCGECGEKLN